MRPMYALTTIGLFVLLLLPFAAAAQETASPTKYMYSEKVTPKEYTFGEKVGDRITLMFTFQVEKKQQLIYRIWAKRDAHVAFLMEKGKTEQAMRFNQSTSTLVNNFEAWKARKTGKMTPLTQ